ncbi:MAG: MBL fold metallo-hydrolase [Candidatus Anstonellaceae archaeon]
MVEIIFLGTGGGRVNLISQQRRTAGFRINASMNFHIDPGPGSMLACKEFSQDPRKTNVLIVTHSHIDHVNDAGLVIEAMTNYALSKQGYLIASSSVIDGDKYGDRSISRYHQLKMAKIFIAKAGKEVRIGCGRKQASLLPTKVKHEDKTGFGFVLKIDGKSIGYTSDTEYFKELPTPFAGCDVLIANVIKPAQDSLAGHLHAQSAAELFFKCKPKLGIITHLGIKMIEAGPEKEAERIAKLSGVPTIAAFDGLKLQIP